MKACLSFEEVIDSSKPKLEELQRVGDSFADGSALEACVAFSRQVVFVEAGVRQTYEQVARLVRKTESLDEAVEMWGQMGRVCESSVRVLAGLKDKYPNCGTAELYNLVLDYKLACDTRKARALEEKECLKVTLPRGLLPDLS